MSKVNDRGTIKWTSIMMPEQIEALAKMWEEDDYKIKPHLDEQKLEEIGIKLHEAINKNLEVEITYYSSGEHDYMQVKDKIYSINQENKYLKMDDFEWTKIEFCEILEIDIV